MKKINICMNAYSIYRYDVRIKREAEALSKFNYNVDVISLSEDGNFKVQIINGVMNYCLPLKPLRGKEGQYIYQYVLFTLLSSFFLFCLWVKKRYKVIHVHTLPDFLIFSGIIPRLFGVKLILDLHEIMPEIFMARMKRSSDSIIVKTIYFLEKISIKIANRIITVSNHLKNIFLSRNIINEEITVIMNVPDENLISSVNKSKKENQFTLIYPGAIIKARDLFTVIKAIQLVKKEIKDVKLYLIGSGEYFNKIKKYIAKHNLYKTIILKYRMEPSEVIKYIANSDVGIISMERNQLTDIGSPNKIFEYIALQKQVISAESKSIRSLLGDLIKYYISGNSLSFKTAVLKCYQESSTTRLIKQKEIDCIYESIKWNVMKKKLIKLYEQILLT